MLSDRDFVVQSLELNLFFLRIAKEHAIFIGTSLTLRDMNLMKEADAFKTHISTLLDRTISLSDGIISSEATESGELVTDLTLPAERLTEFYTAVPMGTDITRREMALRPSRNPAVTPALVQNVVMLNNEAVTAGNMLAGFKSALLKNVLSCRIFTFNYPDMLEHLFDEIRYYLRVLDRLQRREGTDIPGGIVEQEVFWNEIMRDHSRFMRGLLDPKEAVLIKQADKFSKEFDRLIEAAKSKQNIPGVTGESLKATEALRNFKRQGTQGIVNCKVRSIIPPLLGDHVIREANHYLRLLRMPKREE